MIDVGMILKIFFLINPLTSIPVLLQAYAQKLNVKRIALKAVLLAFAVAIVFMFAGPLLFQIYGIQLDSFRAAGGLVILMLGLSMAREKSSEYSEKTSDALISLIATPLLTGPATLSFLILTAAEVGVAGVLPNLVLAFVLVCVVFVAIAFMVPNINTEYVKFVSRLLGLFLIALGIEMIAKGIAALYQMLSVASG